MQLYRYSSAALYFVEYYRTAVFLFFCKNVDFSWLIKFSLAHTTLVSSPDLSLCAHARLISGWRERVWGLE